MAFAPGAVVADIKRPFGIAGIIANIGKHGTAQPYYDAVRIALPIGKIRFVYGPLLVGCSLFNWFEDRGALVLDEEHDKPRGPRVACIPAHDVNVVGSLVIGLSGRQRDLRRTSNLHHD
jgi:hypothetical protein